MATRMSAPRSAGRTRTMDVEAQIAHDRARALAVYGAILLLTLFMAVVAYRRAPAPFPLALLVLTLACVAAIVRPAVGLYVLVFLTMVGDAVTVPWWPFTKNMSSRESIFFVSDSLIMSPLELLAGVTLLAWLIRRIADPTWRFVRGRLLWPITAFTAFVALGFMWGIAKGGDKRI